MPEQSNPKTEVTESIESTPKLKVKICGVRTVEEANKICNLHPDAIGVLVGFDKELAKNNIPEEQAVEIVETLKKSHGDIKTFMLTNAEDAETNINFANRVQPSHIQLTGDISPEEVLKIKEALPDLEIVKVIHVTGHDAIQEAKRYEETGVLSAILLDSKVGDMTGGTGQTHDWSISKKILEESNLPVWLAGGLKTINLEAAMEVGGFYGVDVETGVQNLDGSKNYGEIEKFTNMAHG